MNKLRQIIFVSLLALFLLPTVASAQTEEESLWAQAQTHYSSGDFYFAAPWLERILEKYPKTKHRKDVLLMISKVYAATWREEKAAGTVTLLVKEFPEAVHDLDGKLLTLAGMEAPIPVPVPASPSPAAPPPAPMPAAAAPVPAETPAPVTAEAPAPVAVAEAPAPVAVPAVPPALPPSSVPAVPSVPPAVARAVPPAPPSAEAPATTAAVPPAPPLAPHEMPEMVPPVPPPPVLPPASEQAEQPAKEVQRAQLASLPEKKMAPHRETPEAVGMSGGTGPAGVSYTLKVGQYVVLSVLAKAEQRVKAAGMTPIVKPGPKKMEPMVRLYLGEFAKRALARKELEKLHKAKGEGFIVSRGGSFHLYGGSFINEKFAVMEQERLTGHGLKVTLEKKTIPVPTHILTAGRFPTREAAEAQAAELKKTGITVDVLEVPSSGNDPQ